MLNTRAPQPVPKPPQVSALAQARQARMSRAAYDKSSLGLDILSGLCCAVAAFDASSGELVHANTAFEQTFAAGADAAGSAPWTLESLDRQFQTELAASKGANALAPSRTPLSFDDSDRLHQPSGRWFNIQRSQAQAGAQRLVLVALHDISQRLADEQRRRGEHQQLLFTSKVMSVGEMAATLAHELNQPIGSLLNYLNGCVLRLDRSATADIQVRDKLTAELRGALLESRQQCERAAAIITRIREFVRTREPKMGTVDLGELFSTVATLLRSEIRLHQIEVRIDVPADLPAVWADRVMIEQVAHNLSKNAVEAMRYQTSPRQLCLSANVDGAGMVEASVQDSGPGVNEAARSQLFSPFFTTKADGLGIGLNICRSMMEFHGGSLYYSQPPEGGSRFCFSLPGTLPSPPVGPPSDLSSDLSSGLPAGPPAGLSAGLSAATTGPSNVSGDIQ
jgi:signal transduction histidine kinase